MPIYEYQCKVCGYIEEDISSVDNRDEPCSFKCPLCLQNEGRDRIISIPAEPLGIKHSNNDWPYLSDMTETVVKNGKKVTQRAVMLSKRHQDEFMKKNGYVYYEEPSDVSKVPTIPSHLEKWKEHPHWKKYQEDKRKRKVPDSLVLTKKELMEKFDVSV